MKTYHDIVGPARGVGKSTLTLYLAGGQTIVFNAHHLTIGWDVWRLSPSSPLAAGADNEMPVANQSQKGVSILLPRQF